MGKAIGIGSGLSGSGQTGGGSGGGSTSPVGVVTAISVTGFIDPLTNNITLTVGVTPPSDPNFKGCHLFLEIPDQSSAPAMVVGSSTVGGAAAVTGNWFTLDCGKFPYVLAQQPWTFSIPGPFDLDATVDIPARLYAISYSTIVENQLVQANQPSPSPNQTFTCVSLDSGTPTSGTNITGLTVASGAQVGIVATALAPVNVTGKLETPVEVIVTDTPGTKGWCFQLVLTYVGQDATVAANQFVVTALQTQAGPVPAAADGISVPHSFALDTPTAVTRALVWLQAGLVDANGNFQGNNIVPGITPSFPITYGSTVGTTDASAIMTATIAASMAIVNNLFGVATAGITNSLLGSGAVATINVQNLAITNPLLASLAVQAANLATGSVTATAIAALAVGTAAIQTAAITNALIANLAVSGAQIQSATITGANIASATIAGANIGTATIAQGNMASASIGTAQIQSAAITNAKIASLAVSDANINDCAISKLTAGTATFTGTVTFQQSGGTTAVVIASGAVTIQTNGSSNKITLDNTNGAIFTYSGTTTQIQGNQINTGQVFCTGVEINPATTYTSATGGAATALPSNPTGYVLMIIAPSGIPVNAKIPYYT